MERPCCCGGPARLPAGNGKLSYGASWTRLPGIIIIIIIVIIIRKYNITTISIIVIVIVIVIHFCYYFTASRRPRLKAACPHRQPQQHRAGRRTQASKLHCGDAAQAEITNQLKSR